MWSNILTLFVILTIVANSRTSEIQDKAISEVSDRSNHSTEIKNTSLPNMNSAESGNSSSKTGQNVFLEEYYTSWSGWSKCTRRCDQTRVRRCFKPNSCGRSWIKEKRSCKKPKKRCSKLSYKVMGFKRRNKLVEELLYEFLYSPWSQWGPCTRSCRKRRQRKCEIPRICGNSYIQEERKCRVSDTPCAVRYTLTTPDANGQQSGKKTTHSRKNSTSITRDGINGDKPTHQQEIVQSPELMKLTNTCGIRPEKMAGSYRIVSGDEVRPNSWPWQVAILTRWREQYCGGTLIAPRWVLTAAHCVRKRGRRRKVLVRIGEHDIHRNDGKETDLQLARDFPHPDFDYETINNDIALLKLKTSIGDKFKAKFACIPISKERIPDGTKCHIVGWGKEKNADMHGSDVLLEAEVPTVSRNRCQKAFDYKITNSQICAGYKRGGKDSCAGDSGGPLLCPRDENGSTRWYLSGVTSYGEGCGQKGKYGIYTNVSAYLDWIHKTIESH